MAALPARVLFGAAYYHEYQPYERLKKDLELMALAGFSVIRVGENAQAIGSPWKNRPAFDGQWRQAAWALVSRSARMIEYWYWHTLHFGTETYWGGVLPHSGRPGRAYAELADASIAAGSAVRLGPWDVRVLVADEEQ